MLLPILTISAYTVIVVVVVFLAVYSKMYDWWKSPMGRVMNFSLIANAIVAAGIVCLLVDWDVAAQILGIGGLSLFTLAIIWRLRLLISTYRARIDDDPHNDYPASADYNHSGE